ncbi:nucleotide exchange factor GrpE [Pedobacter sp.]|nr:nucleotide exchange factor GrpE [Candidatus Saccharibacteria bacterium]
MMPKKTPQTDEHLLNKMDELTLDLQRTRADFENYRKRVVVEKDQAKASGKTQAILKLLPVIDNIERSIVYMPEELKDNEWAMSVAGLVKNLERALEDLDLHRIEATPGTIFDPEIHEAIAIDDGEGDQEVIAEELQSGYCLGDSVIRPSMVKVSRR